MLKLKWEQSFDYWKCYPLEGAIMVLIRQTNPGKYEGMWEIVIGVRYWSRDMGKYFHDPEIAKQQAEILLAKVCQKMLIVLESLG